jgi:hypothetical protein
MMRARRAKVYGLTPEQWEAMNRRQRGLCANCHQPPTVRIKVLHVDHCHSTGKVRGLLCRNCNVILGLAHEDPNLLRGLADYLERFQMT